MIKIGLVGVGHLGLIHLKLIQELSDYYTLIGIYDSNADKLDRIAAEYKCKAFHSLEELMNEVDCLDIVTPTTSHFEIASVAIKHSLHVFIEKPITQTVSEAQKLLLLAQEAAVKVQVGHVERFNPAFKKAHPFIKQPMFIETHRLAQFNPRGTDVPVVLDLMIHDIDIILSIVNSSIRRISASGVAVVSDTPDIANTRIEFDNGCVANLTASRISMKNMRKSRFFQKDAYISVDFLEKEMEVVQMETLDGEAGPFDMVLEMGNGKPAKRILFDKPDILPNNAIKDELFTFYQSIKDNTSPIVSLEDGMEALLVAKEILNKLDGTTPIIENNIS